MNLRPLLCVLAVLCCCMVRAQDTPGSIEVTGIEGDAVGTYDLKTGLVTFTNGVIVRYGNTTLIADFIELNQQTGEAFAAGGVVVLNDSTQVWRGERVNYNLMTRVMSTPSFRAGQPPFFITASNLVTVPTNGAYIATNAMLTTDDHARPNVQIRARRIVIVAGRLIEARHAVLYVEGVPVMYFPYYHKTLDRHPNNFDFLAGYRGTWGPFLLSTYNWYWNERLNGALHFDARGKRGFAGGPDFKWQDPTFGDGLLRYYYAHDIDPRRVTGFETPPRDRQRLYFQDQWRLRKDFTVKSVVAYQSDPFITRDFFEGEYQENVQPKSFVEADKNWQNWNLNALTQFRVNDYQETVERLPDVKLTGLRQQVGPTPFYYETESSAGYFRHLYPVQTNLFYPARSNYFGATRVDTFHQLVLPWTFFGWLNVIPRVGQRLSYYSEADGRGATTGEEYRSVFNTGAEVTWKASRLYSDAESSLLDVNGLRHIIQPSINYVLVDDPTARPDELPQFDTELPTSRLLPIEFPDYNAIDAIDSMQVIRLGLRNRLQTKREGRMDYLLNWAVYGDWRLKPRHNRSRYSDIYSDIDFKPRTWLVLNSETRYHIDMGKFREANHTVTVQPNDVWSVSLGHRYRMDTPELGQGNNIIAGTLYYRLNENWGVRISEHFEARDGTLEYQYYTIYRDFRSWTGALTLRIRDDRDGPNDYTVAFTFSLKAFPRYSVGDDAVRPMRLIGG